jgi:hypothetical protein
MSFQPVLPLGGFSGWRYLQTTLATQQARFAESATQAADRAYFKENIASVQSAEDLVSDYRLLRVTLGAYGLQDDLPNRAFIQQVLEQGTDADTDLANKLANKSYRALANAFNFGSAADAGEANRQSGIDRAINDERYFRDTVTEFQTVDDLLSDGRALRVALAAFDLSDDLPNRQFLRDVFEGGTSSPSALANQLDNPKYAQLVDAFGFSDDGTSRTGEPAFASTLLIGLDRIEFGKSLEEAETTFASSVEALPDLTRIAGRGSDDRRAWVEILSDPALRTVFTSTFGLTRSFDRMNLDQQITALREGARDAFGEAAASQFADSARITDLMARYSEAVAFDDDGLRAVEVPGFADQILQRFDRQQFELAVGEQDSDLRLALNLERELPGIANAGTSDTTAWLTVLGLPPLRSVFETAFSMPDSIGTLDLDQQLTEFRNAAERVLGSSEISQFSDPDRVEDLIRTFTLRSQIAAGPSFLTRGASAVILLQNLA